MTRAEYLKMLRAQAKAEGRCSVCRARGADYGRLTCGDCRLRSAEAKARNQNCGLCHCGRERADGLMVCNQCRSRINATTRRRHSRAIAEGRCTWGNGSCWLPAIENRKFCLTHLYANCDKSKATYASRKAAGICKDCRSPELQEGRAHCAPCLERRRLRQRCRRGVSR